MGAGRFYAFPYEGKSLGCRNPKPPSDEGGGSAIAETEGEKT